jgi:hypothetical protein
MMLHKLAAAYWPFAPGACCAAMAAFASSGHQSPKASPVTNVSLWDAATPLPCSGAFVATSESGPSTKSLRSSPLLRALKLLGR